MTKSIPEDGRILRTLRFGTQVLSGNGNSASLLPLERAMAFGRSAKDFPSGCPTRTAAAAFRLALGTPKVGAERLAAMAQADNASHPKGRNTL
jgi:hypothetical protein